MMNELEIAWNNFLNEIIKELKLKEIVEWLNTKLSYLSGSPQDIKNIYKKEGLKN